MMFMIFDENKIEILRKKLIEVARRQYDNQDHYKKGDGVVSYTEAASWVDVHCEGSVLGDMIGEVSKRELIANRPPLSVLVVYRSGENVGYPADNFVEYMKEIGDFKMVDTPKNRKIYINKKMRDCWSHWSTH